MVIKHWKLIRFGKTLSLKHFKYESCKKWMRINKLCVYVINENLFTILESDVQYFHTYSILLFILILTKSW